MTVETFTPAPLYTVAAPNAWPVPHAYLAAADLVVTVSDPLTETVIPLLVGEDFTVTPAKADDAGGTLMLTSGPLAEYDGWTLAIARLTPVEQGFNGKTARERAIERQFDRHAMALQDRDHLTEVTLALPGADLPTYAEVQLATVPAPQQFLMVRGKTSVGDGLGGLLTRVEADPDHDGGVQSADGQWWEPARLGRADVLKITHYLRLYDDHADALRAALIDLFQGASPQSDAGPMVLDGEGIELQISRSVTLDPSDGVFGNGDARGLKWIRNLFLIGVSGGTFTGADTDVFLGFYGSNEDKVRNVIMHDCRLDGNNYVGVGLELQNYYHFTVAQTVIKGFTYAGLTSRKLDESTAAHGLLLRDIDILGSFAGPGGTSGQPDYGVLLEDGDAVISGGWVSWTQVGVLSKRGGLHVSKLHLSLADDNTTPKIGIQVNAPRVVLIDGCDMDGCSILLVNSTDNTLDPGVALNGWRRISIRDNEFHPHPEHSSLLGFIIMRTTTASQSIKAFACTGNVVIDGQDLRILQFGFTGSGTWATDWEGIVNNAGIAGQDASNFPGRNILGQTTVAGVYTESSGHTVVRSTNANTRLALHDSVNGGAGMPFIESNGAGLRFGAADTVWFKLSGTGDLEPAADDTITLGTLTERFAEIRTNKIRCWNLVNAVNDAAAASGGVPVNGFYRNGSVLMVRVS